MSFRNNRFYYRLATEKDSTQILGIMESGSFAGNISVLYTRRPDPIRSLQREGDEAIILVMEDKEKNRIGAVGCCTLRNAYVNGEVKRTAYLSGLKVHPEYQRQMPGIPNAYRFLYEETKDRVDLYYTTILKENTAAQKLLEKKRKGMPEYRPVGEYTVYCFRAGRKHRNQTGRLKRGLSPKVEAFYRETLKEGDLAPASINIPGIRDEDFYVLQDSKGQILAACVLWNQQPEKQHIITGYQGAYRFLKFVPLHWLGYPNLPKENTPANYAAVTLLAVRDQNREWAEVLLGKVAEVATGYDFMMLGLFENHPLNSALQSMKTITYGSKLYTVHWTGEELSLGDRRIHLEVGLL